MATKPSQPGRLIELLAGEAAGDLTAEEVPELNSLLAKAGTAQRDELWTVAALVQLSFLQHDPRAMQRMPQGLKNRLRSQVPTAFAALGLRFAVNDNGAARRRSLRDGNRGPGRFWLSRAAAGWYLAAAFALALLVVGPGRPEAPVLKPPAERRAELVRSAPDLATLPWTRSREAGFEKVSGDVVWSNSRQEGYLRLAGLPVNDPGRSQYQLWIVDPERDSHPVDGGVFDVTTTAELTIPVNAKLVTVRPTAFAITLEQPGGVVVSDGPLLVVASVTG